MSAPLRIALSAVLLALFAAAVEYLVGWRAVAAAWREVPWTDLSRGMGNSQEQLATDEGHLRVFWRKWSAMVEQGAPA